MNEPPFSVREPEGEETPVVVEVPHAGLHVPAPQLHAIVAPARSLARDADLYVDDLYVDAPLEGATILVAHASRYVVDLNRGEKDYDSDSVTGGPSETRAPRGVVWRLTTDGEKVMSAPISRAELEARLEAIYRPYHAILTQILARKVEKFGLAVLLAAHSMPSVGRTVHGDPGSARADVVPGTRGRASAEARFIDAVDAHARAKGWSVQHDNPYRGGFATQHYGRPSQRIHAVQVELARRLYMDETNLWKLEGGFEATRAWCRTLVTRLGQVALR